MNLKGHISHLFQSLFGLVGINDKEIKICLGVSLLITIAITMVGGWYEFRSEAATFIKSSLATIEHFSNALPFSIFLCLVVIFVYDFCRGLKMRLFSDGVRQKIEEEVTQKVTQKVTQEVTEKVTEEFETKWAEWAGDNNVGAPPPWETQGHSTGTQDNQQK